ncbi:MAG: ComF family protein, partial [Planctomycetaceae bacterium]
SKLRGGDRLLAGLAELVWRRNSQAMQSLGIDVVVPVPLYFWQGLLRPHNPAAVLAEVWGKRLNAPSATHILRKIRWTEAQARLNPTQRRVNVQNAFAVAKGTLPAGATVLLADDVLTTGTTANEAARVLKRAGAARVVVAVLARGLGRR